MKKSRNFGTFDVDIFTSRRPDKPTRSGCLNEKVIRRFNEKLLKGVDENRKIIYELFIVAEEKSSSTQSYRIQISHYTIYFEFQTVCGEVV